MPEEEKKSLTPKQQEILSFVAVGLTNKEIAVTLSITQTAVRDHIKEIFSRLGVTSRAQAVTVAKRGS